MRALLAAAAVLALAGPAHAEEPTEADQAAARAHYEQGLTHYNVGDYPAAIEAFKEAYRLSRAPGLLYNIAQAYRLDGNCAEALKFYRNYLREDPEAPYRAKAEARIVEMERCVADAEARARPPAEPLAAVPPPAPRDPAPPRGRTKRFVGVGLAVVGAVGLGVAVYYRGEAAAAADEIGALYESGGTWNAHHEEVESRGQEAETVAVAFTVAGGVALAAGGALYYLGWREGRRVTVSPAPGGGGVTAAVSWSF